MFLLTSFRVLQFLVVFSLEAAVDLHTASSPEYKVKVKLISSCPLTLECPMVSVTVS